MAKRTASARPAKSPRGAKYASVRNAWWRRLLGALLAAVAAVFALMVLLLFLFRWVDPPITGVQIERRIEARLAGRPQGWAYRPVPLSEISPDVQHAVIAAEDARFYMHSGIDFKELRKVVEEDLEEGRFGRGGSTLTQQLVKNLFFTTSRSFIRKGCEFVLAPIAEFILPKDRILELYLNVVEWGPGIFGVEAAARHHYGISAARLSRAQAVRLAAVIPSPLRRRPERMNSYAGTIDTRMRQMGW